MREEDTLTKFNRARQGTTPRSPIASAAQARFQTAEGAQGFERSAQGELFVLGAGRFFGEASFYESAHEEADRFRTLVHEVALSNPEWLAQFLKWLRSEANIRTAAIVGAVEYVHAMQRPEAADAVAIRDGGHRREVTPRAVVRSVLQRADEPGEMIAYYLQRHGRSIPHAMKRGIADAITGIRTGRDPLYSEYSVLKYDTPSHGLRFGDVVELVCPATVHPSIRGTDQGNLIKHVIDRRHGRDEIPEAFDMLTDNAQIRAHAARYPETLLDVERLSAAGFTWEDALSLGGSKLDKRRLWESLIDADALGYMALLRNLRAFDEAGISNYHAAKVASVLRNSHRVRKSRQLPFRFFTAAKEATAPRWSHALEQALNASTENIPELPGRTLVLVDTSGSMQWTNLSSRSGVSLVDTASLFGVALSMHAAEVDLYGFADSVFKVRVSKGGSVLRQTEQMAARVGTAGNGTRIVESLKRTFRGHDRVVIFTDMQTMPDDGEMPYYAYHVGNVSTAVPPNVPIYAWNLVGYKASMMPTGSGNRHEFGGFSDSAFSLMQTIEAGRDARWPWEASKG